MIRPRAGFALVEMLLVVTVAGILWTIAAPRYDAVLARATATRAASDVRDLVLAARLYEADTGDWPAPAPPGEMPPGLERYLDGGVEMRGRGYTLAWDVVTIPEGRLAGVTVTVADPASRMGAAVARVVGPGLFVLHENSGRQYLMNPKLGGSPGRSGR